MDDPGHAEAWRLGERAMQSVEGRQGAQEREQRKGQEEWYLQMTVTEIDRLRLLPPLVVAQMVARNPRIPLRVLQPFIADKLRAEDARIAGDRVKVVSLEGKTRLMLDELRHLETRGKVFRDRRTRELPAVHFLCGRVLDGEVLRDPKDREHSYSLADLTAYAADTEDLDLVGFGGTLTDARRRTRATSLAGGIGSAVDDELGGPLACPQCQPGIRAAIERKRQMLDGAPSRDVLMRQLDASPDGFDVVAEYFEKGLLDDDVIRAIHAQHTLHTQDE
jgi:hypothetical protein